MKRPESKTNENRELRPATAVSSRPYVTSLFDQEAGSATARFLVCDSSHRIGSTWMGSEWKADRRSDENSQTKRLHRRDGVVVRGPYGGATALRQPGTRRSAGTPGLAP